MTSALVKICGITNKADFTMCNNYKADFTGFVLHPESPRKASAQLVKSILAGNLSTIPVLVFGFDSYEFIKENVEFINCGNALIQVPLKSKAFSNLEKSYSPKRLLPVVHVSGPLEFEIQNQLLKYPRVILDSAVLNNGKIIAGGTGKIIAVEFLRGIQFPFILAGGLHPENVCKALKATGACGADTASGTEKSPGLKDENKVRLFIERVKEPEKFCS